MIIQTIDTISGNNFSYTLQDIPDPVTEQLLGETPGRWARMSPLSRGVVVESARILEKNGLLKKGRNQADLGRKIGLIGGSKYGSLSTDLAFAATLQQGVKLASPALFGYTLANIPLAEAANHFGLKGPVFCIIHSVDPMDKALEEAERFLKTDEDLDWMLVCGFDCLDKNDKSLQINVDFSLLRNQAQ